MTHWTERAQEAFLASLSFSLLGKVDAPDFFPWMDRHAHKLGVSFTVTNASPNSMSLHATGPAEMLDAFALACSLGPQSVNVEAMVIDEVAARQDC